MKKTIFFILLFLFIGLDNELTKDEENIYKFESNQKINVDLRVIISKLSGIRKAASSILWVKQGLQIGDIIEKNENREFKIKQLHQSSLNIAYLDPYFKQNYYTGSTVLAFIKTLQAHKEALEILQIGIKNNPSERLFKMYAGAIVAGSKNETEKLIVIIEEILNEKFDDEMAVFLTKVYEKKYTETGRKFYLNKAVSLLEIIIEIGTEKNRDYSENEIKKLKMNE